jgi:hypothetical protein
MFVGKAVKHLSCAPLQGRLRPYSKTLERLAKDKHSFSLRTLVNYCRKKVLYHWSLVRWERCLKVVAVRRPPRREGSCCSRGTSRRSSKKRRWLKTWQQFCIFTALKNVDVSIWNNTRKTFYKNFTNKFVEIWIYVLNASNETCVYDKVPWHLAQRRSA